MTEPRPAIVRIGRSATAPRVSTAVLKSLVREVLQLGEDQTVLIQQLACAEPGCPPVETVIAVLSPDRPPRRWTLHRPVADITPDDLRTALADRGGDEEHDRDHHGEDR